MSCMQAVTFSNMKQIARSQWKNESAQMTILTDNCGLPADAEAGSKSSDSTSAAATAVSFIVIVVTMVTRVVLVLHLKRKSIGGNQSSMSCGLSRAPPIPPLNLLLVEHRLPVLRS